MDSGSSDSGAPCYHAFRNITNIERSKSCSQSLTGISGENNRKRRRPFYEDPGYHDKGKNEVAHSAKASEACEHATSKIYPFMKLKSYDSESSKLNYESQSEWPVYNLNFKSASSGQISRLHSDANNSSIGHLPSSNTEAEDISTKSNELIKSFGLDVEQYPRVPAHTVKDHKEPAVFDHSSLDLSLCKNKTDVEERLIHEKSEYISLCGRCPCSSCTKAAYMWSDLVYQDIRGRLRALKSSRRHAVILEGKILRHEKTVETSQYQSKRPRSTESDLLQHWTSLLLRTEDTLLCEIMQTQSRLIEIENLKDKFKTDLETMNSLPQNKSDE